MNNLLGTRISHYRIIDALGEGGMGQVYVGYDEKLDRKVALKVIKADHKLNAEAKARFLREARMLSKLAHPNICQIFDYIEGDSIDFLVLELIPGQKLTEEMKKGFEYKQKLKIAEQIACVLVAAHEKGIIHRDLKPDNIMLAQGCQVKVLDFGLSRYQQDEATLKLAAQAADGSDAAELSALENNQSLDNAAGQTEMLSGSASSADPDKLTRKGLIMGTLDYMSPEQARGEKATTASDLYSFGIILQELFTGKPTFDKTLSTMARLEKIRVGETLPAEGIDTEIKALITRLKSLAPATRPSAVDTAERLVWIQHKPARRLKKLVLAAAIGVLAIFGVAMTVQTIRATRAEKAAKAEAMISQRVSEFLVSIFQVSDPSEAKGNAITAREILDQGAKKIDAELQDQPLMQSRLMDTMGNVYSSLGLYKKAQPLLENALKIREKLLGPNHSDTATSFNNLADIYFEQGKYAEAEPLYKRALAIREKILGPNHYYTGNSLLNLASLYREQGKYVEAEPLYKRALSIREKALGPNHKEMAVSLNNLAGFYLEQGKYEEAEPLFRRTLVITEKALGPDHPNIAKDLNNLAELYREQGKYAEAELFQKRSLAIREKILGPNHPGTAASLNNLANIYFGQGKYAEAEPLYKRALAIAEKILGLEHPNTAASLNNLADVYQKQGKYSEAEPLCKHALAIREKILGPNHPNTAYSLNSLARLYYDLSKFAEAEPLFKRSLAIREKVFGPDHPTTAESLHNLAKLYRDTNKFSEAEPLFKRALEIREKVLGKEHPKTAETLADYAKLLRKMKRDAEAEKLEARAKAILEKPKQKIK
jgi:tetratricopeptide (TPR) repeat protein